MSRHLHPQAGGDPTQHGPARELADQHLPDDDQFPDGPAPARSGSSDLSDEQLADMAAKFGLDTKTDAVDTEPDRRQVVTQRARAIGASALAATGKAIGGLGRTLTKVGDRLTDTEKDHESET